MADTVVVATIDELPVGAAKQVEVGGKTIALFNVGGSYFAIDDTCPHRDGPLSEGVLEGNVITCPWHGAKFSVLTGEVIEGPASAGVCSYRIRVEGTDVLLTIP